MMNNDIRRHSEDSRYINLSNNVEINRRESASGRFQVTKSGETSTLLEPSTSHITAMTEKGNLSAENQINSMRKVSSAGRFKIFANTTLEKDRAETAPPEIEKNEETEKIDINNDDIKEMHVHFSLGIKDEINDTITSTADADNSTLMNQKSWRHCATLEHPPIIDFYRNTVDKDGAMNTRPSMMELLRGEKAEQDELKDFKEKNVGIVESQMSPKKSLDTFQLPSTTTQRSKFGWIEGVFFRCLLNIFGVMLYLRVSWVSGQAGILLGTMVVLLASVVTTITALSTCAICTNGDVKGGGAYFLISRSLGPEFGGSIGLIFSVANAVGAAMYVVGFAETVRDLFVEYEIVIIDGGLNDVRIIGLITCIILMCIVFIGTGFESKMQMGLLVILSLSILDYFIGTLLPVTDEQRIKGITGYSSVTLMDNLLPNFRDGYNFFTVFSIYFPAATGIMAGANISGDLADPQKAIPLGTLSAIFVTTIIYIITIWSTGSTCVRDADGINFPEINMNSTTLLSASYIKPDCTFNNTCKYGLMNYFQVMEIESFWGPLITAGIFAATLSSALASLVSAPKIFQAVCKDRLFPYITYFSKGTGKNDEPRRAYMLGFVISMVMIIIGDLNAIAPIISNFFLCSYALINYACFDNSFAHSPGFRPGFKYYNMWVSLIGSLLCIIVMFIISWFTALLTFIFFGVLFMYLAHRKPDVNWGSSTQAHSYRNALISVTKLEHTDEHVKNYRPQLLVLTGNPAARPSLVDFASNITKGNSLMVCSYVVPYPPCDSVFAVIRKLNFQLRDWLKKRHIKSFYTSIANPNLKAGVQALYQTCGLGRLKPNIVLIGFKQNWSIKGINGLTGINDYFGMIQDAFDNNMSVMVLRNSGGGLDFSDLMREQNLGDVTKLPYVSPDAELKRNESGHVSNTSDASADYKKTESDNQQDTTSGVTEDFEDDDSPLNILNSFLDEELAESTTDDEIYQNDSQKLNIQDALTTDYSGSEDGKNLKKSEATEQHNVKFISDDIEKSVSLEKPENFERMSLIRRRRKKQSAKNTLFNIMSTRRLTTAQRELLASINRFQRKVKNATIDVWWLYDDGGLTLLIPYLLTQPKSYLENAKLRVFTLSTTASGMEQEARNMAALLSKFRINYSDVKVISDFHKKPQQQTRDAFEKLIEPFRCDRTDDNFKEGMITEAELSSQKDKTQRQLRISELIHENSSDSDLIVLTLPVPRKGLVSSCLYMSWVDIMTRNLPPTLLVRGNQQSVLTFYS